MSGGGDGAPKLTAFVDTYTRPFQAIENVVFDVLEQTRDVTKATAAQLDGLCALVGLVRAEGDSDARLRVRFAAQVLINKTKATIDEILAACDILGTGAYDLGLTNHGDGSFTFEIKTLADPVIAGQIARAIFQMKAAGVYAYVTYWTTNPYFGFAEDASSDALGFDDGYFSFAVGG